MDVTAGYCPISYATQHSVFDPGDQDRQQSSPLYIFFEKSFRSTISFDTCSAHHPTYFVLLPDLGISTCLCLLWVFLVIPFSFVNTIGVLFFHLFFYYLAGIPFYASNEETGLSLPLP